MAMTIRVTGDDVIMRKLGRMGVAASDVLEAATVAAATVIQEAATSMAPGPHIGQETTSKARTRVTVAVGPVKAKWYYRFFETGTRPHTIRGNPLLVFGGVAVRSVNHPGMAARPFLRPALDTQGDEATQKAGQVLRSAVYGEA